MPQTHEKFTGLMATVRCHMPFSYAVERGFCPKRAYFLIQDFGFATVKQAFDYYVSIHKSNPSYYWYDQDDNLDITGAEKRFCRFITTSIKQGRKPQEECAGPYYFAQGWGKKKILQPA